MSGWGVDCACGYSKMWPIVCYYGPLAQFEGLLFVLHEKFVGLLLK